MARTDKALERTAFDCEMNIEKRIRAFIALQSDSFSNATEYEHALLAESIAYRTGAAQAYSLSEIETALELKH